MEERAQQELEEQRYKESVKAILECIQKGVSPQAVEQLIVEAGIDRRDLVTH